MMIHSIQKSESIELGILLALSGGFMDAYSYIERGKVFANAQTGNMLLLGIHLSRGQLNLCLKYFFPVLAFTIGIALADIIKMRKTNLFHWRQMTVILEIVIFLGVSMMPQSMNLIANSLTSLACGLQVESFRKIHGQAMATTMCIGNLRSATSHMIQFFYGQDLESLKKGCLYFGIIICFILGAVIGHVMIGWFHEKAILGCCCLLIVAFGVMFIDEEKLSVVN